MNKGSITIDVLLSMIITCIIINIVINVLAVQIKSEEVIENKIKEYESSNEQVYKKQRECEIICDITVAEE